MNGLIWCVHWCHYWQDMLADLIESKQIYTNWRSGHRLTVFSAEGVELSRHLQQFLRHWVLRVETNTLLVPQSRNLSCPHAGWRYGLDALISLKVTDRSFQYASPHLWNQLPFSLCEPVSPLYAYPNPSFSSPLPHPSPLHSFTLNSKLTFLVNLFRHRSVTIDTSDWLPRLMGPFSVFTVFVGVISCFWCGRQN